jgi:hypothetical protein
MTEPFVIAQRDDIRCALQPDKANRHGLITGATGTGKTITLQTLAEAFSGAGVPVFMADVKGDLTGIAQAGTLGDKLGRIIAERKLPTPEFGAFPVTLWDVFGAQGHPVRATVSDLGPLLLARMLNLNDTQAGVLAAGVQDRRRPGPAAAGHEGLAQHVPVRRRQRVAVHHQLRQHQRRQHRRDPARADADREPGRRPVLRRADAQHRRLHADRRQRQRASSTCWPPTS